MGNGAVVRTRQTGSVRIRMHMQRENSRLQSLQLYGLREPTNKRSAVRGRPAAFLCLRCGSVPEHGSLTSVIAFFLTAAFPARRHYLSP